MNEGICSKKLFDAAHRRHKSRSKVNLQDIIDLRCELIREAKNIANLLTNPQAGNDTYLKKLPKILAAQWGFTIYPIVGASKCGVYANIQLAVEDELRKDALLVGYCDDLNNYLRTSVRDEYIKHLTGNSELIKAYVRAIAVCDAVILMVQPYDAAA